MERFLMLEAPYLGISAFIMAVFFFIATRPFISPLVMRRGLPAIVAFLSVAVGLHYVTSENRADEVRAGFEKGEMIFCSERRSKAGDRNIEVLKGDIWKVEGDFFVNADGNKFSIRQCVVTDIRLK